MYLTMLHMDSFIKDNKLQEKDIQVEIGKSTNPIWSYLHCSSFQVTSK